MIPAGKYTAQGQEFALGRAKTGTEQIAVRLVITKGEYEGTEITWYGYFTEAATERTLESLRHLGWKSDDLITMDGLGDTEAEIVIDHEPDLNGEPRARVRWINAPGSGLAMSERLDDGAARALAARIKGQAIASRKKAAPAQPRPQHRTTRASEVSEPDDFDIPF